MKSLKLFAGILAVASLFVVNAPAEDRVSNFVTDDHIQQVVERNLKGYNVGISVDDRIITLTGTVPNLKIRREAENKAWPADNGVRVENKLVVSVPDLSDSQIASEAMRAIRRYPYFNIFDWVEAKVDNGVVTLSGVVDKPWRRTDFERVLESVDGVREIKNELRRLPLSAFDDDLRNAVSKAIYTDPVLIRYANQPRPPIHIIVENGKVRLQGVVGSEMEKRQAEIRARHVTAFEVKNELQVAS